MDTGNLISSDPDVVHTLLAGGADPHAFVGGDAPDVRPLAVHCYMGRSEAVRLLLRYGADPNLGRESTAETPLHHATA